ncbi:hypothetical protein [Streptomyces sp. NPDC001155]
MQKFLVGGLSHYVDGMVFAVLHACALQPALRWRSTVRGNLAKGLIFGTLLACISVSLMTPFVFAPARGLHPGFLSLDFGWKYVLGVFLWHWVYGLHLGLIYSPAEQRADVSEGSAAGGEKAAVAARARHPAPSRARGRTGLGSRVSRGQDHTQPILKETSAGGHLGILRVPSAGTRAARPQGLPVPGSGDDTPRECEVVPLRVELTPVEPLRVSILARDPLADEGIASYLRNSPVMRVLPSAARGTSDVCVVIDNDVNAATWRRVEYAAKQAANPALRMVLIADAVPAHQLQRARRWGVVSVLPRSTAVREQVLAAVFAARISGLPRQAGSTPAHLVQPAPRQDSAPRTALTTREIHPSTTLLPKEKSTEADVCLVVDDHVGTATLTRMENLARMSTTAGMRMVLIAELIQEQQFLRAVHWGLSSVLLRKEAERERVVKAVIGAHTGRAEMPPVMIAWLAEHLRSIQRDILAPRELTSSGLLSREIDVLRLLADGLDTSEVAPETQLLRAHDQERHPRHAHVSTRTTVPTAAAVPRWARTTPAVLLNSPSTRR